MKSTLKVLSAMFLAIVLAGCTNDVREVPAGHIAKILTPSGWKDEILEAGQVDIGIQNNNGTYNVLVLLEATSITVKEQFIKNDPTRNNDDHRFMTLKRIPVAGDIYARLALPEDKKERDAIFAMVTPKNLDQDGRRKIIKLEDVYMQFASPDIRSRSRAIIGKYEDDMKIVEDGDAINEKLLQAFVTTFKQNRVPLQTLSVSMSNVKADEVVMAAESQKSAANAELERIKLINDELQRNPAYLEYYKWTTIKEISALRAANGLNTIIITDGSSKIGDTAAAAEVLRQASTNRR